MEFEKLTAQVRTGRKKGVARRLRREGFIPAVCYGPDMPPLTLSVEPKALSNALSGSLGRNVVIQLNVEGEGAPSDELLVMLHDYQYHPVERTVLHADFLQVSMDRDVHVHIPFVLTGRSVGVQQGGVLTQVFRSLPVCCRPEKIPPLVEHAISALGFGDILKVSELELPKAISIEFEPNQTLANVVAPTVVPVAEEAEEGEEEAGEEGEAPAEEAAPATE